MQLISLNTLAGFFLEPLLEFVKTSADKTDFFLFQEVTDTQVEGAVQKGYRPDLFAQLKRALPGFQGYFASMHPFHDAFASPLFNTTNVDYGIATFFKKNHSVVREGSFYIYKEANAHVQGDDASYPHSMQYVGVEVGTTPLIVCNFYGTARPGNKLDTPERILQSQKALDFLSQQKGEKIIAGDFNLLPETESVRMFERAGFHNLVKEFSIPTTRGTLVKKMHPEYADTPEGFQEFADYAFISQGITATAFTVPDLPISDHLPLILDFAM